MGKCLAELRRENGPRAEPTAGARSRAAAAKAIEAVIDGGRSLTDALDRVDNLEHERDASLVRELSFGTLRMLPRLQAVAAQLLHKPLKRDDGDLSALLLVGLYQLSSTRIPPHAAVSSSVEATRVLGKEWSANLVNALLRRFQREHVGLLAKAKRSPEARWLFPSWLLHRLQIAWPDRWQDLVEASNTHAPMTLRVNRMVGTRADYAARLALSGLTARPVSDAPSALVLDEPIAVDGLPGFSDGAVSVQDAGAQLAAPLLGATPGHRVLDACAAPGGKTTHVLEDAGNRLDLTAVDVDERRLELLRDSLRRLSLRARVVRGDAAAPDANWGNTSYHRVLLDVPCSATGVIRRHPDIKWLRRDADVTKLSERQSRMLDALWPLLQTGGTLLYATCSLLPEENDVQVSRFLARHPDAREAPIAADWGVARPVGRQTLPTPGGLDGFYYARLVKAPS